MDQAFPFTKLQATGNDFVLIDLRSLAECSPRRQNSTSPPLHYSNLALAMCDRHFGIGADGLLVLTDSTTADFRMRFFNPDGTEDMCGNGTRCVARYMMEREGKTQATYRIETIAGLREVTGLIEQGVARISVNMGKPSFCPESLPACIEVNPILDYPLEVAGQTVTITALSTGTPHTCIFSDAPVGESVFQALSPKIENHACFPERTSVLWIHRKAEGHLALRIWERAVGETLSCGTGACAALVAANLKGLVGRKGMVESRGGVLEIEWREDEELIKTGPAEIAFRGNWRIADGG